MFFLKGFAPYKKDLFIAFFALVGLLVFIPVYTYFYFAKDLGSKETIMNKNDTGVILYDRHNTPFFNFFNAKQRDVISLSEISPHIQHAVIAVEDKEFYSHPGFSMRGIARALYRDLLNRDIREGGSTISQQLIKNAILTSDRSFVRKYQEIVLAQELERRYTKDEILEMYLNSIYFGEGAFGVQAAAENYFNKHASELTIAESALLAGVLTAPSQLSPISGDIEGAKNRQTMVLEKMHEEGYISQEDKNNALDEELVLSSKEDVLNSEALHFALMVRDELFKKYSEEEIARSGFHVTTTLDLEWQRYTEDTVQKHVVSLADNGVTNGAAVVEDPKTGEIKALVGSRDWYDKNFGKVNIAITPRQPGSSFKPIVYSVALETGELTAASLLKDEPIMYVDGIACKESECNTEGKPESSIYKPLDYDKKFRGTVLVRRALANSLNIPSVEVLARIGIPQAVDMAKRFGITTLSDPHTYGLALVLGAAEVKLLELTNVYATFANNGVKNTPTTILEIRDKNDKVIYTHKPEQEKILEPSIAFLISSILSDNRARAEAFGNALTINRTAAVKTGTTEGYRDAWTLGYTPSLTVGVWVGNNDNTPMDQVAGSLGAAPIWKDLMQHFLEGTPSEKFNIPEGVITKTVCRERGLLTQGATSSALLEYFVKGTEPDESCYKRDENESNVTPEITPDVTP